jgi:hypothetical protein
MLFIYNKQKKIWIIVGNGGWIMKRIFWKKIDEIGI